MAAIANALTAAFTDAMQASIVKTAAAWLKAQDEETKRRVNFGREVGKARVAIVAAGGTDDDAEGLIMPTVTEVVGTRVLWGTVKDWCSAASVFDSLPKDLQGQFNTEALKTLQRVPLKPSDKEIEEGKKDRATFAAEVVGASVRDLRKAVSEERKSSTPKKKQANASQAEETVTALKTVTGDLTVPTDGIAPEVVVGLVMIGVLLRDIVPKHLTSNVQEGITQFFGPNVPEADDGSGADDS